MTHRPKNSLLAFVLLTVLAMTACAPQVTAGTASLTAGPPVSCPVTGPSSAAFIPPSPYSTIPPANYPDQFWFGTTDLWTMLRADGTWSGLPHGSAGYSQKVFWFSTSYDINQEPSPNLTVTGKRLDVSAAALTASAATDASADFGPAMLTEVNIPTPGCWQITGSYKGHGLSFVVWVAP